MKRVRPAPNPAKENAHLSSRQFFHVAPQSARSNIEKFGLDHRHGSTKWDKNESGAANFLWASPRNAYTYQHMANLMSKSDDAPNWTDNSGQNYDVYEVNMPKVNRPRLENDPEFLKGEAVFTRDPIPRRFLRRIG